MAASPFAFAQHNPGRAAIESGSARRARRLPHRRRARHTPPVRATPMKYLAIIAAIVAAIALSQLLFQFYEWNRLQSCATGGGRNCGLRIPLNR
jgi:hypothetical protein